MPLPTDFSSAYLTRPFNSVCEQLYRVRCPCSHVKRRLLRVIARCSSSLFECYQMVPKHCQLRIFSVPGGSGMLLDRDVEVPGRPEFSACWFAQCAKCSRRIISKQHTIHAHGWWLHSKCVERMGSPSSLQSLQIVLLCNLVWSSLVTILQTLCQILY